MTDLKQALRAFDDVGPDAAVFRRAKGGPTRAALPGRPRGERLIAGVTAVAVFALAATFAWRVLRATDDPGPPGPATEVVELGSDGSTLWPQRTRIDLVSAQSGTDAGNAGFRWQLDPREVLDRFAESVMGWPLDTFRTSIDRSGEAGGTLVAHLERTEETCPPFTPEDEARGVGRCLPGVEEVTLVQPMQVGAGGVWVVRSVSAPLATIDARAGQIVPNGATVGARLEVPDDQFGAWGSTLGYPHEERSCGLVSRGGLPGTDFEIEVGIRPDALLGADCGESVPGYLVLAASTNRLVCCGGRVANPFDGDSSPYVAVTAVPILVSIPENRPAPGMNVYEDPLGGWKVDLPEPWYVAPVNDVAGERTLTISNDAMPVDADTPRGPDPSTFPSDLVVLEITRLVGEPPHESAGDDTAFPLEPDLFRRAFQTTDAPIVAFQGNGLAYRARLFVGDQVSDDVLATMLDVVRSLRFPSLAGGAVENGWMSLGKIRAYPGERGTATSGERLGVIYVVRGTGGAYVLDLERESCGEGQNQTWDRERHQILIECPDGSEIRYERDGTPVAGNPPGSTKPLDVYPAITAWDDTLLISVTTLIDDVERYWPHA